VKSQVEVYRAKVKEYARLTKVTKSGVRGAISIGKERLICKIWYLISRTVSEDDASRQQCKIWYLISPRFALAGFFFPSVLGVGSVSALFLAGSGKVGPVRSTQRSAIVHVPAAFT